MNILYSKAILAFLKKANALAREIANEEMGLKIGRTRFSIGALSYPLHFVVFDHPSRLGYFEPNLYEIGLNKIFLLEKEEEIKNVLRHELAHYITYIEYGEGVSSHGKEFKEVCKRYGWPTEISSSTISFEKGVKNRKVTQKVQKLLSLSSSPNPEEAKAATLKARALLKKYQIELQEEGEENIAIRVLEKRRSTAKLGAIALILRSFHVYPVFNQGKNVVYLELFGEEVSVQVGEYVAHFLDHHFERLWQEAKKENSRLRGMVSKNSFFRGLAKGYKTKETSLLKGVMKIEKELITTVQKAYPHLRSSKSSYFHDEKAEKVGRQKGKLLHVHEGIPKNSNATCKKTRKALTFKNLF